MCIRDRYTPLMAITPLIISGLFKNKFMLCNAPNDAPQVYIIVSELELVRMNGTTSLNTYSFHCWWRIDLSRGFILLLSQLSLLMPVSYTHLRAHETPEHLVCRLLL